MSFSTMNNPRVGVRTKKRMDDKYSIKSLVFLHATSNYVIPVDTEGHKVFFCVDCGDKFVCESSYNYHVNRRSVKITYCCRICSKTMVYMNRCNLLSHIRSHVFKTATINLVDLKIEPLPKEDMVFGLFHLDQPLTLDQVLNNELSKSVQELPGYMASNSSTEPHVIIDHEETIPHVGPSKNISPASAIKRKRDLRRVKCLECNTSLRNIGTAVETRQNHYMLTANAESTCPICNYKLPSTCALKAHLRMHTTEGMNFLCPECGKYARSNHFCGGYRAVKMAVHVQCPVEGCGSMQELKFFQHYMQEHIKSVFKCSLCISACFTEAAMKSHVANKHSERTERVVEVLMYYQCQCCPGRLVIKPCLNSHIQSHRTSLTHTYPCRKCGICFNSASSLLDHIESCDERQTEMSALNKSRVLKEGTKMDTISSIDLTNGPKETHLGRKLSLIQTDGGSIKCPECDIKLNLDWNYIKKHFSKCHKNHKCVDVKLLVEKLELDLPVVSTKIKTYARKKRKRNTNDFGRLGAKRRRKNILAQVKGTQKGKDIDQRVLPNPRNEYTCLKCGDTTSTTSQSFKDHLITHRDPSTAYQCMECGFCFVVKPSFSTHLFVAHGIKDAEHYIISNKCFNEDAFKIVDNDFTSVPEGPLKDNQCKICRELFQNEDELSKHFRVHGMAFIMTKKHKK